MRACRFSKKAQRLRLVSTANGGPSPLPLSHWGEGFPACRLAAALSSPPAFRRRCE